jgi:4-alpha-glucanotransferase
MEKRTSGVLLHVTSLPSGFGIGDLGPEAYGFVDFLEEAKLGLWQVLPLSRTGGGTGNSPYSSPSAFARNTLLISPELLMRDGLLSQAEIDDRPVFSDDKVDFDAVRGFKVRLLHAAYERKRDSIWNDDAFRIFCDENDYWLSDYTLFAALLDEFGNAPWREWPDGIRNREQWALHEWGTKHADAILREKFFQFVFFKQWSALKRYCNAKGVRVIGDMPLYLDYNSDIVWRSPESFKLDATGNPLVVAGVPPDYFSETGQLWGNPVFNWDRIRNDNYWWWLYRIRNNLESCDMLRLDHFRGLVAYWEVPAGAKTAVKGAWVKAPAEDFLGTLSRGFPDMPFVAEDLGIITPDVREMMRRFDLPGMKVLLFAFGPDMASNDYAPHRHVKNCIVYPGTHDNNTIRGWFDEDATPEDKEALALYLGRRFDVESIHWDVIRMAMMSVADAAIVTMQDFLGLGKKARMNTPGQADGNWEWRLPPGRASASLARRIAGLVETYGRG